MHPRRVRACVGHFRFFAFFLEENSDDCFQDASARRFAPPTSAIGLWRNNGRGLVLWSNHFHFVFTTNPNRNFAVRSDPTAGDWTYE